MAFAKVYLGSSWPLPSVTKFTNLSTVGCKVQLAFAHHEVLRWLVEPYEYTGEAPPSFLNLGGSMSEFQALYRSRKQSVFV